MRDVNRRIREVVLDMIKSGATFSSGDVSNEVKKDFPSMRHGDVATQVRLISGEFLYGNKVTGQTLDYEIATIYPPNINAPNGIFVYHPRGTSVRTYRPPQLAKPKQQLAVPAPVIPKVQSVTKVNLGTLRTESQGRIRIPRNMVDSIKQGKKLRIEATKHNDEFALSLE